jgi:hypothetical protein
MFSQYCFILITIYVTATVGFVSRAYTGVRNVVSIKMAYLPDGFTQKQWDNLQKAEIEAKKIKKNEANGATKFRSRSFEAWQKAGGDIYVNINMYMYIYVYIYIYIYMYICIYI